MGSYPQAGANAIQKTKHNELRGSHDARRPRRLDRRCAVPRRKPRVDENAQRRRGQLVAPAFREQVDEGRRKCARKAVTSACVGIFAQQWRGSVAPHMLPQHGGGADSHSLCKGTGE